MTDNEIKSIKLRIRCILMHTFSLMKLTYKPATYGIADKSSITLSIALTDTNEMLRCCVSYTQDFEFEGCVLIYSDITTKKSFQITVPTFTAETVAQQLGIEFASCHARYYINTVTSNCISVATVLMLKLRIEPSDFVGDLVISELKTTGYINDIHCTLAIKLNSGFQDVTFTFTLESPSLQTQSLVLNDFRNPQGLAIARRQCAAFISEYKRLR